MNRLCCTRSLPQLLGGWEAPGEAQSALRCCAAAMMLLLTAWKCMHCPALCCC